MSFEIGLEPLFKLYKSLFGIEGGLVNLSITKMKASFKLSRIFSKIDLNFNQGNENLCSTAKFFFGIFFKIAATSRILYTKDIWIRFTAFQAKDWI